MCLYFLNYLRWVFPASFTLVDEDVLYNDVLYSDSRELLQVLINDYVFLGEEYYNSRRVFILKDLAEVCSDETEFAWGARQQITELAFQLGFEARSKRIFIVMGGEINDWFLYLVERDIHGLKEIVLNYVTDTYKGLLSAPCLVGVMKSFVERHRDEFIRRFEQQQPELAEILRELDWPAERDKFFSNDPEFKKVLLERLDAKGKGHLLEYILGEDLAL